MHRKRYFKKDKETLGKIRLNVSTLLALKGYNESEIEVYLKAFDYFTEFPDNYDGATIVKDLCDLDGIDLDAMLHDYQYDFYGSAKSFKTKFYSDWIYAKGQERKGKGSYSSFSRFLGLCVIGLFFVPYSCLKRRNQANSIKSIKEDFNKLIK